MKIVVNKCYGGFGLSHAAVMKYLELKGKKVWLEEHTRFSSKDYDYWLVPPEERQPDRSHEWHSMSMEDRQAYNERSGKEQFYVHDLRSENRDDPHLVQVVEELGKTASGECAKLEVVEIPDGVEWVIEEYDGTEWVAEKHRTW